jgi:hypothetical protein
MVAVETRERVAIASGDRDIEQASSGGMIGGRILRRAAIASSGVDEGAASHRAITTIYRRDAD